MVGILSGAIALADHLGFEPDPGAGGTRGRDVTIDPETGDITWGGDWTPGEGGDAADTIYTYGSDGHLDKTLKPSGPTRTETKSEVVLVDPGSSVRGTYTPGTPHAYPYLIPSRYDFSGPAGMPYTRAYWEDAGLPMGLLRYEYPGTYGSGTGGILGPGGSVYRPPVDTGGVLGTGPGPGTGSTETGTSSTDGRTGDGKTGDGKTGDGKTGDGKPETDFERHYPDDRGHDVHRTSPIYDDRDSRDLYAKSTGWTDEWGGSPMIAGPYDESTGWTDEWGGSPMFEPVSEPIVSILDTDSLSKFPDPVVHSIASTATYDDKIVSDARRKEAAEVATHGSDISAPPISTSYTMARPKSSPPVVSHPPGSTSVVLPGPVTSVSPSKTTGDTYVTRWEGGLEGGEVTRSATTGAIVSDRRHRDDFSGDDFMSGGKYGADTGAFGGLGGVGGGYT